MNQGSGARPRAALILATLLLVFATLAAAAMLRTSSTFDEIIFPAAGARGFATGDFGLILDHPPLMQYVYGIPVALMNVNYPPEAGRTWNHMARYEYARALLWGFGNVPERIIATARLVSILLGALLVWATFMLSRRSLGTGAALLAAALVAFLPDVLAHSGVTYNDVPLALALFVAVSAADRMARDPTLGAAALAGFASAIAIGVKLSGIAIVPILLALIVLEALGRWKDAAWRAALVRALPVYAVVLYATLVAIYLGDARLERFLDMLRVTFQLDSAGRPALLLGERSNSGFWYFFPLAFVLKTPAALHGLVILALGGAWLALRRERVANLASHPLRAAAVAAAFLTAALMASKINIGFRHALPVLPFVCVLVAAGSARVWSRGPTALRALIVVLVLGDVVSVARSYPYFLSYVSEYARGRPLHQTLVDSNTDWGQGLVALKDFMRERGIERIYLSYLGSALPEGYGIRYVSLPSFLPLLEPAPETSAPPRYLAISATTLAGLYVKGDPFAELRSQRPVANVGGSIVIYELPPTPRVAAR
jgi:hypothetical protein